jgi:hypothetical protein
LAADNVDVEGVQAKTAELNLEDAKPKGSLKRESEEDSEPNIYSAPHTPMPNPFKSLNNIPYPYILKRLFDLGPYFVGHESTAQAFVQAIPMNDKNPLYKVESSLEITNPKLSELSNDINTMNQIQRTPRPAVPLLTVLSISINSMTK